MTINVKRPSDDGAKRRKEVKSWRTGADLTMERLQWGWKH